LTGGIGSGKSEVARLLASRGAKVVSADELARRLVEPGSLLLAEVVREFGPEVLKPDGALDRAGLARVVFGDRDRLAALDYIMGPPLVDAMVREVEALERAEPNGVVVVDAALLVDWDVLDMFDVVVAVVAPKGLRLRRLVRAGLSEADAAARIDCQRPDASFAEAADVVIENAGTLDDLESKVTAFWDSIAAVAGRR